MGKASGSVIGYDLDGVIAPVPSFRWLEELWNTHPFVASFISASLVGEPICKPSSGYIITGRGGQLRWLTMAWMWRYGIELPLVMTARWHADRGRSREWKLRSIRELGVSTYYEDDSETVIYLRLHLLEVEIVHIGGDVHEHI